MENNNLFAVKVNTAGVESIYGGIQSKDETKNILNKLRNEGLSDKNLKVLKVTNPRPLPVVEKTRTLIVHASERELENARLAGRAEANVGAFCKGAIIGGAIVGGIALYRHFKKRKEEDED